MLAYKLNLLDYRPFWNGILLRNCIDVRALRRGGVCHLKLNLLRLNIKVAESAETKRESILLVFRFSGCHQKHLVRTIGVLGVLILGK